MLFWLSTMVLEAVYFAQNLNLFAFKAIPTNYRGPIGNDGPGSVQFIY